MCCLADDVAEEGNRRPGEGSRTGEVADPAHPLPGCYFHRRRPYAVDRCRTEPPPLREVAPGQSVSCHLAEGVDLTGVA